MTPPLLHRALLTLFVLVLTAGLALADVSFEIRGGPSAGWEPYWWNTGPMRLRAEWNADPGWLVDDWRNFYGAPPNRWEVVDMNPQSMQISQADPDWWAWANNGIVRDLVTAGGVRMIGGLSSQNLSLQLGNEAFVNLTKYWYIEFELDHVPTNWWGSPQNPRIRLGDVSYFSQQHEYGGWLDSDDPASGITLLESGWVAYDAAGNRLGNPYTNPALQSQTAGLVWWSYVQIDPQPYAEKILWGFNLNTGQPTDDFRIARVVTGTYCIPEPGTLALFALGLPGALFLRRRAARRRE